MCLASKRNVHQKWRVPLDFLDTSRERRWKNYKFGVNEKPERDRKKTSEGWGEQCLFVVVFLSLLVFLFIVSCDVKATSSRTSMSIVYRIQEKCFHVETQKICVFSETCAWENGRISSRNSAYFQTTPVQVPSPPNLQVGKEKMNAC